MRLWGKGVDQDCCNTACRDVLLLALPLHAKWTLPQNQLYQGYQGSSWWPKEALEAGQPLTPGLVVPWPGLHRLHTDGSIPTGAPTSENRWQWAALPAPSLMNLLSTSLKLSAIIPLFAFHLRKICLLVYHWGVFYPAEQKNDCMHSCNSYSLGQGFASYSSCCSLPKSQLTDT